jgi:FixJ family two-component response regulator
MNASIAKQTGISSAGAQPIIGIVDDDPVMGESLVQRLELEGYQARWWQSGEEALSQLRDAARRVLVWRYPPPRSGR